MKNIKIRAHSLFFLCLFSLVLISCEKDEERAIFKLGEAPALNASASNVVLSEATINDNAVAFTWSAANYGLNAAVTYTLEFDKKGNNFADAVTVAAGNTKMKEFTVSEFNALAFQLGLEAGVAEEIEVRVQANVAASVPAVYSNPLAVTTTAFASEPPYPTLYMVGPATEFDWEGAKGTPMFRDDTDPFVYTFTGYLEQGDLFVLGYLNQWGPMWGTNSEGTLSFRPTDKDPEPWKIWVPANGYYTFTMNLRNLTYTLTPFDAASKPVYNSLGITGGFNNWGNVAMTKTTFNPHLWTLDYTIAANTELKFSTPDWSASWGATGNWERLYGKLTFKVDGNLWILAGSNRILFNDLTGHYVFIEK